MSENLLPPAPRVDNFNMEVAYQASYAYSWQQSQTLTDQEVLDWLGKWHSKQFSTSPLVVVEAFGLIDGLSDVLIKRSKPLSWFECFN